MKFTMKRTNSQDRKFINKDGTLTAYSFHCGYVELYESNTVISYRVYIASPPFNTTRPEAEIRLYKEGAYKVAIWFYGESGESVTYCYDTLREARARVYAIKKQYRGDK